MNQAQQDFHEQGQQLAHVQNMHLSELQARAQIDGVNEADVNKAMDSDDPRHALASLLILHELKHGSPPPQELAAKADDGQSIHAPDSEQVTSVPILALVAGVMGITAVVFVSGQHVHRTGRFEPLLAESNKQ